MSEDTGEWRWVGPDGVQKDIDEWDLVSSLSGGTLPANTLVWKRGWKQWLPASSVAELASAMPDGKAGIPVEPELGDVTVPPEPPLEHHKASEAESPATATADVAQAAPAVPPPPPPAAHRGRGGAAAASLIGRAAPVAPPPPAARPPMPTLVEQPEAPTTSATLRPPGAVPPPPRRMPTHLVQAAPRVPALETPLPRIAIREKTPDESSEQSPLLPDVVHEPTITAPQEPPTLPLASPAPIDAPVAPSSEPLPSWDIEAEAQGRGPRGATASPAAGPQPRFPTGLVVLGAVAGALAALVVVLLVARGSHNTGPVVVTGSAVAPGSGPAAPTRGPCTLAHPAKRIATEILQSVPPYLAAAPDGRRVVVGLAATSTQAVGLVIDPETLDVGRAFDQVGTSAIVGVVPTVANGKLAFTVDRDDAALHNSRTVDGKRTFTLGMNDDGLARAERGKQPVVVWPGGSAERMTEIRVATTPNGEHAVTFRRGGLSGHVLAGWLEPGGAKKTELARITTPALVGTPMVAANDDSILVVFAARSDKSEFWRVALAPARDGALPADATPFAIPAGGPGKEAISPAATGLGSSWVLQWTEGTTGQHDVRIQTLDSKLAPVGDPVTVSPRGANAGQGVVWVQGNAGLSLFLVAHGKSHELWGAALKCP